MEWLRDDLFWLVQSTLRFLPKFRDQPVRRRRGGDCRGTRSHHARPSGNSCHNINFVTPEHVVPQILEALVIAVERGLRLPLVYNTSAYDSPESIQWMNGLIDIYMPDFKLWDAEHCRKYLVASNYAEAARRVIAAMHAQVGELKVDEQGLVLHGVLVRHL